MSESSFTSFDWQDLPWQYNSFVGTHLGSRIQYHQCMVHRQWDIRQQGLKDRRRYIQPSWWVDTMIMKERYEFAMCCEKKRNSIVKHDVHVSDPWLECNSH